MKNIYENYAGVLELNVVNETQRIWHVKFSGAAGTLYSGETFTLQFKFDDRYPFEAAEVMFVGTPPIHEHVYANGYICLSILDKEWTPALQTSQVCMSILSMLSSATEKKEPPNN
jgi:ubiquitin-conjugating enzyme E2 W